MQESIVASATACETAAGRLNLIVPEAPCSHPDWRMESSFPFVPIFVRRIVVLELEFGDTEAQTTLDARQQSLLTVVPPRPASGVQLVAAKEDFVPTLTVAIGFLYDWPRSTSPFDIHFVRVLFVCFPTTKLPVHGIVGIVAIAAIDDDVESLKAVLLVKLPSLL